MKPANVVLTAAGEDLDFGVAARVGHPSERILFGTPAYLAPERLDGDPACPAADVYAVGILLYQCLTGRIPWQVNTDDQVLHAHRFTPPAALPPIAGLPPEIAELCAACLSKVPSAARRRWRWR